MTTRSIGKFLPALNLRLGTKAVICAIFLIAVNTALVVGAAHWSLTSEFGDRALRDIEVNLRTLSLAFAETYGDAKITSACCYVDESDPKALDNARATRPELVCVDDPMEACRDADLVLHLTEWPEFRTITPADVSGTSAVIHLEARGPAAGLQVQARIPPHLIALLQVPDMGAIVQRFGLKQLRRQQNRG
mgnify:CR=1 FL=1